MATIKGVALKAIKTNIGHDHAGFQANIYLKNKKIGEVTDDGWGGPLQIHFDKEKEAFYSIAKAYKQEQKEKLLSDDELIIHNLLTLSDLEKEYKKAIKKGYESILFLDYRPSESDVPVPFPSEEIYLIPNEESANQVLQDKKPVQYKMYTNLNDFVII